MIVRIYQTTDHWSRSIPYATLLAELHVEEDHDLKELAAEYGGDMVQVGEEVCVG